MIFLGGTCGNNNWREAFIEQAIARGLKKESLFNPVVPNWNKEAQELEDRMKVQSEFLVFYVADPKENGNPLSTYSMVEAVMALYDKANRAVVVFDVEGMSGHALKAMNKVYKDLKERFPDANIFGSMETAIQWLDSVQ